MKKIVILLVALFSINAAIAQKQERTNAFMYNKNGQYDKAKESIDKAATNEKTINDSRTWFYRGMIYLNIVSSEEFAGLDPDALGKSYESFKRAIELDPDDKEQQREEILPRIQVIGITYFQEGVNNFNEAQYGFAAANFKKAYDVALTINKVDTLALLNAALASTRGNEFEIALSYYQELKQMGVNDPDLYKNLASIYRSLEDRESMMAVLDEGLMKFPGDPGLVLEKINAYLVLGRGEEVIEELKLMVEKDPSNHTIFFVLGTIYGDEENNPDIFNKDTAIEYYKKAIAIKPDYFDAVYNLGALYINEANKITATANELPLEEQKKYEEMTEEAAEILRTALPYVEKAHELDPSDATKAALLGIYSTLKMNDKIELLK
ncbi:MAG: tetratricopeptide repeat protein [Lentimicrobiaceae bacterium]|jgi:tetratricopeptide (TPR) repeat protein|nr:tetratricopeptide repeat protein [Lentimicrobiaceae bacterium]